jgi:uncharacterized protein
MARKRAFRIGRSRTGLGLFATGPIKKGTFIVEYKGRKLTNDQADSPRKPLSLRDQQPLDDRRIEPEEPGTLRKPLVQANAETHTIGHKVIIRAIKNIRTGAEITHNYGRDYLTSVITKRGCKCDKCRKQRADARAKARAKGG